MPRKKKDRTASLTIENHLLRKQVAYLKKYGKPRRAKTKKTL